jgi:hypothetical protein
MQPVFEEAHQRCETLLRADPCDLAPSRYRRSWRFGKYGSNTDYLRSDAFMIEIKLRSEDTAILPKAPPALSPDASARDLQSVPC